MKQKNIKDAANKYADSIAQDEHKKEYCIIDFEAGAKWMMDNISNKWIKFSEKLPDYGIKVLVVATDGSLWLKSRTKDKASYINEYGFHTIPNVIFCYWMPITPFPIYSKNKEI